MNRNALIGVVTVLLALVLMAGCNGDSDGTETPTPEGADATATTAPAETDTPPAATATEPSSTAACSAGDGTLTLSDQPALPDAVAQLRLAIFDAAVACDYDQLEALALAGGPTFNYSFGEPAEGGEPGRFWEEQEAGGDPVLRKLVDVLNLTPGEDAGFIVWPDAAQFDPMNLSPEEMGIIDTLVQEHPDIASWDPGTGYLGYRAGISSEGDWTFFVAGD